MTRTAEQIKADRDENIAAISAELHGNPEEYRKFYDSYAPGLNGFPGIWRYCIEAADAFTEEEHKLSEECAYEYPEAIETFTDLINKADYLPSPAELRRLAAEAINQCKHEQ